MEGSAYPASQLASPYAFDYDKNIQRPKYDPELAKKLLAEAGYPNGFESNFDTPNDRYVNDQQVAEAIAAQLAKVGIRLKVIATPKAVFFPKVDRFESPFLPGRVGNPFLAGDHELLFPGKERDLWAESTGADSATPNWKRRWTSPTASWMMPRGRN